MKAGLLKFSLLLAIALVMPSCQLTPAQGAGAIAAVSKTAGNGAGHAAGKVVDKRADKATKPRADHDKGEIRLLVDGIVELY